jgi:hypothetical protein
MHEPIINIGEREWSMSSCSGTSKMKDAGGRRKAGRSGLLEHGARRARVACINICSYYFRQDEEKDAAETEQLHGELGDVIMLFAGKPPWSARSWFTYRMAQALFGGSSYSCGSNR